MSFGTICRNVLDTVVGYRLESLMAPFKNQMVNKLYCDIQKWTIHTKSNIDDGNSEHVNKTDEQREEGSDIKNDNEEFLMQNVDEIVGKLNEVNKMLERIDGYVNSNISFKNSCDATAQVISNLLSVGNQCDQLKQKCAKISDDYYHSMI